MRVLLTSWAWSSHYFPLVPLGWALRAAGHEVRVASPPGLTDAVLRSGLPAVVTGRDVDLGALYRRELDPLIGHPGAGADRWDERRRRRTLAAVGVFVEVADAMVDDLVAFGRAWRPDLVVHEPTTFAGPVAAAVLGVPAVEHLWGPDFTSGADRPDGAVRADPGDLPAYRRLWERFGLGHRAGGVALTVDPCAPSLQQIRPGPRQWVRYVPYNGAGSAPDWLLQPAAGPRVCVTWGTSMSRLAGQQEFPAALAVGAAADLAADVVVALAAGTMATVGQRSGVRTVHGLPLHLLLPTCSAVVHQGGAGTTMTAAVHGVPQLVLPQLPDQVFNARQLARTGAGRWLASPDATVGAVRENLEAILAGGQQQQASVALQEEILAQPTPAAVVPVLARLAGETVTPIE